MSSPPIPSPADISSPSAAQFLISAVLIRAAPVSGNPPFGQRSLAPWSPALVGNGRCILFRHPSSLSAVHIESGLIAVEDEPPHILPGVPGKDRLLDLADLALSLFGPENGIELESHPPVRPRPAPEFDG
jgi:hypothetical protein